MGCIFSRLDPSIRVVNQVCHREYFVPEATRVEYMSDDKGLLARATSYIHSHGLLRQPKTSWQR